VVSSSVGSSDRGESAAATPSGVLTVADVTDEHRGWELRVDEPEPLRRRYFVLGKGFGSGVRRWTHSGIEYVGLTDDVRSLGVVGTERIYPADTPCELVRQVVKRRKR
jgi:hypothetical protein